MRVIRYAFVAATWCVVSCGGPGASHSPEANLAVKAADSGNSVSTDAKQLLHGRLASAAEPLVKRPFGTGAAVTGVLGSVSSTAALGTVSDGGPVVGEGTRFNVASVSKVLTAARIVSLAHAKVIGLDDPVAKYLPGVKLLDKDGVDRAGTITIRQLVRHQSGLPHVPKDLEQKVANRWSSLDLLRSLTDSWDLTLEGAPGQYRYSNTGYALLAAIIERSRHCSFADCMATYLGELGMTHSTFWPATLDEDAARGRVVVEGTVRFNSPGWYASRYALPFSGLWTSMPDLARFGSLIAAASKDPSSPLHEMSGPDGKTLGLFRNERLEAMSLEHDGSGPGFHAALVIVPSKGLVLAMATNGGNETKEEATAFGKIVGSVLGAVPSP